MPCLRTRRTSRTAEGIIAPPTPLYTHTPRNSTSSIGSNTSFSRSSSFAEALATSFPQVEEDGEFVLPDSPRRSRHPIKIGPPALRPELRVSQEAKSQSLPDSAALLCRLGGKEVVGATFFADHDWPAGLGALMMQLHPTHDWPIGLGALVSRKQFTTIFLWACAGDALILGTVHSVPGHWTRFPNTSIICTYCSSQSQ